MWFPGVIPSGANVPVICWLPPPAMVPETGLALNQASSGDSTRLKVRLWLPEFVIVNLRVKGLPFVVGADKLLVLKEMLGGVTPVPVTVIKSSELFSSLLMISTSPL